MPSTGSLWELWADEDPIGQGGGSPQTWTFPDTELGIKVEIAWGADPSADPSTWTFTDVSDRLLDKPVRITRGRGDGQGTLGSSSCTFTLKNLDGELTPTRKSSTLWPNVRRTTPVRISLTNVGPNPPYTRFTGFIASFALRIVPGAGGVNISTVQITAAGVTRRLSQGAAAKSPLKRTILGATATTPDLYWSMEDGPDSTANTFKSGISGGAPLQTVNPDHVLFGSQSLRGSQPAPVFECFSNTGGFALAGQAGGIKTTLSLGSSGFSIAGAFVGILASSAETVHWRLLNLTLSGGTYTQLYFAIGAGCISGVLNGEFIAKVIVLPPGSLNAGPLSTTTGGLLSVPNPFDGEEHAFSITMSETGGTVTLTFVMDGVTYTDSEAGTIGTPTLMTGCELLANTFWTTADALDNLDSAVALCHLNIVDGGTTADLYQAARGYVGERDHTRVARVLREEGIPSAVVGEGIRLGPQPIASTMEILRDCEPTGRGIITEPRDGFSVGYIARTARYNRTPAMTIDLSTYRTPEGTGSQVLVPIYDDQRLRNQWTITRSGGIGSTEADDDSVDDDGLYDDGAEANVEDDQQTAHVASWRAHEGSVDELRYPAPPVDPHANPTTLLEPWLTIDLGDVIVRTNAPAEHTGENIEEVLMGYAETIERKRWTATTSVVPSEPWQHLNVVGSNDANRGRVGSKRSTVNTQPGTSGTSLSVAVGGVLWRTGATNFPIDVGPEVMTVTNISGGSSPQTFTVVRSVNGVVNDPDVGEQVRLHQPGVYAL